MRLGLGHIRRVTQRRREMADVGGETVGAVNGLLDKALENRGMTREELVPEKLPIEDFDFPLMKQVANEFLLYHIIQKDESNPKTYGVLYDTDVDGLFSGYILEDYLKRIGMQVKSYINKGKRHGLQKDSMDWAKEEGIDYLYIVDGGSGDEEQIKELRFHGIEVTVLDHHSYTRWETPEGVNVVNITDEPELPALSGCGVVYRYIEELAKHTGHNVSQYEHYVGITVISDVCDLTEKENRYYVSKTHEYLQKNPNDYFFRQFPYYGSYRSFLGFTVIPYLNALIRIGKEDKAVEVVNNMDNPREMDKIRYDITNIKDQQKVLMKEIEEVSREVVTDHTVVQLRGVKEELGTLNGLLANKKLREHDRNSMVLFFNKESKKWQGSFRGVTYGKSDLREYGIEAEGHEHACGVSLSHGKLVDFLTNFEDPHKRESEVSYDVEIGIEEVTEGDLEELAKFNELTQEGTRISPILLKLTGIEEERNVLWREKIAEYVIGDLSYKQFQYLDEPDYEKEYIFDISVRTGKPSYELILKY